MASPTFVRHTRETAHDVQQLRRSDRARRRCSPSRPRVSSSSLTGRLAAEAERVGVLDVAYRLVDSPLGPLLVATTTEGLVRVAFECEDHDAVLASLASTISPRMLRSGRRTDRVARQFDEYFEGTPPRVRSARRPSPRHRVSPRRHRPAPSHHLRDDAELCDRRGRSGQPSSGPRSRQRVCAQPGACRCSVPPRDPQRRHHRAVPGRGRREDHAARAGGRGMSTTLSYAESVDSLDWIDDRARHG